MAHSQAISEDEKHSNLQNLRKRGRVLAVHFFFLPLRRQATEGRDLTFIKNPEPFRELGIWPWSQRGMKIDIRLIPEEWRGCAWA